MTANVTTVGATSVPSATESAWAGLSDRCRRRTHHPTPAAAPTHAAITPASTPKAATRPAGPAPAMGPATADDPMGGAKQIPTAAPSTRRDFDQVAASIAPAALPRTCAP